LWTESQHNMSCSCILVNPLVRFSLELVAESAWQRQNTKGCSYKQHMYCSCIFPKIQVDGSHSASHWIRIRIIGMWIRNTGSLSISSMLPKQNIFTTTWPKKADSYLKDYQDLGPQRPTRRNIVKVSDKEH
jgi:hypothetical protein